MAARSSISTLAENVNPITGKVPSGASLISAAPIPMATNSNAGNTVNSSPRGMGHLSGKTLKAAAVKWASKETGPAVKFTTVQAYEAAGIPLPAPRLRPGAGPAGAEGADGAGGEGGAGAGQGHAGAGAQQQAAPVAVAALAVAAVLGRARSRSRAGRRAGGANANEEEDWRADAAQAGAPVLGLRRGGRAGAGRPPAAPAAGGAQQQAAGAGAGAGAGAAGVAAGAAGPQAAQPGVAGQPAAPGQAAGQPAAGAAAGAVAGAAGAAAGDAAVPAGRVLAEDPACTSWSSSLSSIPGGSLVAWEEERARVISGAYSSKRDRVWRRTAGVRVPTQAERLAAIGRAPAGYKGKRKGKSKSVGGEGEDGEGEDGGDTEGEAGETDGSDAEEGDSPSAKNGGDTPGGLRIGAARMRALLSTLVLPRAVILVQEGSLLGSAAAGPRAGAMPSYQAIPKNSEEYADPVELARSSWESSQLAAMRSSSASHEAELGMDGSWAHVRSFAYRRAKELEARAKRLAPGAVKAMVKGPVFHVHRAGASSAELAAALASVAAAGASGADDAGKDGAGDAKLKSAYAGSGGKAGASAAINLAGDRLPTFLEGLPESSLSNYPAHVREYVKGKLAAQGRMKAAARQADAWVAALDGAEDGPAAAAGFVPAVLARRIAELSSLDAHPGVPAEDIGMGGADPTRGAGGMGSGGKPMAGRGITGVHALGRPRLVAPLRSVLPPPSLAPELPWPVPGSLAATLAVNPRLAKAHAKKLDKGKAPSAAGKSGAGRSHSAAPETGAGASSRRSSGRDASSPDRDRIMAAALAEGQEE